MLPSSLAHRAFTAPPAAFLLLLLVTTSSALPLSSSTPDLPLVRRSTGSTLSVTYLDSLDGFYPSDAAWDCPPTVLSISGATLPVRVDGVVIEASNSSSVGSAKEAAFEVVAPIATDWSAASPLQYGKS